MGVRIGRLFGTDIRATGGFFLLLGLYFLVAKDPSWGGTFSIAVIVSLLVHEFGHVYAVRRQLQSESVVILWGMGGLCVHERTEDPKKQIIISLMGPAFSAILGALSLAALWLAPLSHPIAANLVAAFVWINVIWLGVNLLPLLPLDGGRALEAALTMKLGRGRATAVTRKVSVVAAAGLIGLAIYFQMPFAAVIGVLLLMQNLPGRP